MTNKYIQNNIKEVRMKRGGTQLQLAQELGLNSTNRISRWEAGLAYPSVENLAQIANYYKVTPHDLYPELFDAPLT